MNIIHISDTHSQFKRLKFNIEDYVDKNDINVLIHSGDLTNLGSENEIKDFIIWFRNINGYQYKIFIAGNDDFILQNKPNWLINMIENLKDENIFYLEDNEKLINDNYGNVIKFYGFPWQPRFGDWAFNVDKDSKEMYELCNKIPNDTDVLISHGPPYNIKDYLSSGESVGCKILRERIDKTNIKLVLFGHIHYSYGKSLVNDIIYLNSSICSEFNRPVNDPQIIKIDKNINFEINE